MAIAPNYDVEDKTFVLVGGNIGRAYDDGGDGLIAGGELSVVHVRRSLFWFGGYIDALYDSHRDAPRLGFGPELGISMLGLDLGPVVELGSAPKVDFRVRGALTIGVVSVYVGPTIPLSNLDHGTWIEAGVLLKFPHAIAW
jgi:hypothetical protein